MTPPRSDHFNGKTFFQPGGQSGGGLREFLRWKFAAKPRAWPAEVRLQAAAVVGRPEQDGVVVTWIGHSSFLLQTASTNLLLDPVFSDRVSPVAWAGPRRVHPPGVAFTSLPRIDAVLVSHDHYDHCDANTLRRLAGEHAPRFITPLRHAGLLTSFGAKDTHELDWWQSHRLTQDITVTLTPSRHWSNRFGTPRNHRLWGGFFLTLGEKRLWFVGDTGYDRAMVREVRRLCGPPELALVPIGAYEPRWFMAPMHINPAEAVRLHLEVGAARSIGMHWGTFQLTDEAREDPPKDLAAARVEHGVPESDFHIVAPGESITI